MGRSSRSRLFDSGNGDTERHQDEQDGEKRQLGEGYKTEGQPCKKQGCRPPPGRQKKPYACRDQQASGCRGDAAEDVPEDREVSIFKEKQADRKTDCPRDDKKAGNCGDRSDRAPHLCSDAHGNSDDVRPGHELAKAYNVGKSLSLIQRRFSTAMRRAQTMPPPPPTP